MNKLKIKNVRLKVLIIILVLFCVAAPIATYAYLKSENKQVNEITPGTNEIKIEEKYEPPIEIKPGVEFIKAPRVSNNGTTKVFVRAHVYFSDSDAEAFCEPLVINSKWVLESDGYYYYKDAVIPGASTDNIFEKVKIKDSALESEMKPFQIMIYAESVSGEKTTNYKTAWGI